MFYIQKSILKKSASQNVFCRFVQQTLRYVFAADVVRRGREEGLLLDLETGQEMLAKAQAPWGKKTNKGTVWGPSILLMEEILHQLAGSLFHYLQGFFTSHTVIAGFLNHQQYGMFQARSLYIPDFLLGKFMETHVISRNVHGKSNLL